MYKPIILFLALMLVFAGAKADSKDTSANKSGPGSLLSRIADEALINTENDSQRVANIFYWFTHHIAWDTRSFNKEEKLKFRQSKDILKTKTARPREYAQLVKDLCEMAGVKAMVLVGYEKNELHENGASFYNPNHAWNAVLIANKWLLLDACNGAGNQYMDLSWWKKQMQKLHKKKLYTSTKLKFKHEYRPEFLFQDPEEVRLTRVPVDPVWQLTDTIMPIAVFEKEESDIREFNERYSKPKQFSITLSELYNLTEDQYIIECADRTYAYNPRFTEMKASKHIALANENVKKVNKAGNRNAAEHIVKETRTALDTAGHILSEQKKEISEEYAMLRKVNNEKRSDVTKYKQTFTTVNNKHIAAINSRSNSARSKKNSLNADSHTKPKRENDINSSSYEKIKTMMPEKSDRDPEVLKLKDSVMSRQSRMAIVREDIRFYKNTITSEKAYITQCIDSLNVYIRLSDSAFYKEAVARSKKQDSFDDSVKALRSKLYYYKATKLDGFQQLYFTKYDTLLNAYEQIKKGYSYLTEASKKNARDIESLKRMNGQNDMESAYRTSESEYRDAIRGHINNNLAAVNFLNAEAKTMQQMKDLYAKQNDYFDFLINNEDNRKDYVKKMIDKSEGIDKKHNEQKKDMLKEYRDDLDNEFTKVKKKKNKKEKATI